MVLVHKVGERDFVKEEVLHEDIGVHLGDDCLGKYYYLLAQKEENLILYVFDLVKTKLVS